MDIREKKFLELIEARVKDTLMRTRLHHAWKKDCPIPDVDQLSLSELYYVASEKEELRGITKRFVLNYAPWRGHYWFDPDGCDITLLFLWLKGRIKVLPKKYDKRISQLTTTSILSRFSVKSQYVGKKKLIGSLYSKLDKRPTQCDTLLYLGEEVIAPGADSVWNLVHGLDSSTQVLAGIKVHSGYDFFVQGKFSEAFTQWSILYGIFSKIKAQKIVVAHYPAYICLKYIQDIFGLDAQVLYIDAYLASFGLQPKGEGHKLAVYHNTNAKVDCNADIARLLKGANEVIDIDWEGKLPTLSFNYGVDAAYATRLHNIVAQARKYNSLLVVDCLHTARILAPSAKDLGVHVEHIGSYMKRHTDEEETQ